MLHSLATSSHHQSTICPYMDPASACLHGPRGTVQGRWAGDKFAPVAAWRRPVPSHTSAIDQQWPSAYGGLPTVRAVRRGLAAAQRRSTRAGQRDGSGGPRPKEARATGPPQGLFMGPSGARGGCLSIVSWAGCCCRHEEGPLA